MNFVKYVRTKDGAIIALMDDQKDRECIKHRPILKEAYTIEELIDEIIIVHPSLDKPLLGSEDTKIYIQDEAFFQYCVDSGTKVYGAIYVEGKHGEPILKPVAEVGVLGGLKLL